MGSASECSIHMYTWKTSKPRSCTAHDSAATRAILAPSHSEVSVAARRGAAPTALIITEAAGDATPPAGGAAGAAQRVQRMKACMVRPSSRPTTTDSAICHSKHSHGEQSHLRRGESAEDRGGDALWWGCPVVGMPCTVRRACHVHACCAHVHVHVHAHAHAHAHVCMPCAVCVPCVPTNVQAFCAPCHASCHVPCHVPCHAPCHVPCHVRACAPKRLSTVAVDAEPCEAAESVSACTTSIVIAKSTTTTTSMSTVTESTAVVNEPGRG